MQRNELLTPLPEADWAEVIRPLTDQLSPVLNIHRLIAHNPDLMAAYTPLRQYIKGNSSLTDRQRELLILRTAHNLSSSYEWQHHVRRGRLAGLTEIEIERVKGRDTAVWPIAEALLLHCADEMHLAQQLSFTTAQQLQHRLGDRALLDAIFTIGVYLTLGTILRTFDVPFDGAVETS
jgi:alkylhydroperoxidase family enzyme